MIIYDDGTEVVLNSPIEEEALDLSEPRYAEYIFNYIGQKDVFNRYCRALVHKDLSMAEYVELYEKAEFTKWLHNQTG